jgi:acyl-CoA thioester hydrolase
MFVWPVRVYYEDTDSGGVVYYANYLKFMERGRSEWLRSRGVEQDRLMVRDGVLFAVHAVSVDYLRPARFNELLWVTAAVTERGRASLSFDQHVLRDDAARRALTAGHLDEDDYRALIADKDTLLCKGRVRVACLDAQTLRPRPIPSHLYAENARVD